MKTAFSEPWISLQESLRPGPRRGGGWGESSPGEDLEPGDDLDPGEGVWLHISALLLDASSVSGHVIMQSLVVSLLPAILEW